MSRKQRIVLVVIAALTPMAGRAEQSPTAADRPPRPNIIFFYADDLGHGDLGCYGHPRSQTPHLDQLAKDGTRFTRFYVSHCLCSPTRSSVLTGQYPSRWRMFAHLSELAANTARGMPHWLDVAAPSHARALQRVGYRTALFGKWHLGGGSGALRDGRLFINHPDAPPVTDYGFDVARTIFGNSPTWRGKLPVDRPHDVYPYADTEWQTWSSQAIGDAAREFLDDHVRRRKGEPFLLHVWFHDVHTPMRPTDTMRAPFKDLKEPAQTHYASLSFMDRQIGRVLAKLDEFGLRDHTLVLFSSDNGAAEGRGGSNGSLRAWKWYLYEGGIRVPLIARWPGQVPAGRVDDTTLLNVCDLVPTICRLTGARMPDGYQADGIDATEALRGKPGRRSVPMMWHHPTGRARCPALAIRDSHWKLLMNPDGTRLELYDLSRDDAERENVAADNMDVVRRLQAALLAWHRSLPNPLPRSP